RVNRLLMCLDPAGYRWLNETVLKVDRGVDYYNTHPVAYDAGFLLSRALFVLVGLGAAEWSARRFGGEARAAKRLHRAANGAAAAASRGLDTAGTAAEHVALAGLETRRVEHGLLSQAWTIGRFELRSLASSPGLYLFIPLILLQSIQAGYFATGPWGTRLLVTPGLFTSLTFDTLTLCIVFLLLFYTVESFVREQTTGLYPVYASSPLRTGAMLLGMTDANCSLAVVILLAAWLGCVIIQALQHKVRMDLRPFLLVWGLLLVPTFALWTSFVMALMAVTRDRYATYALAIASLVVTGLLQARG